MWMRVMIISHDHTNSPICTLALMLITIMVIFMIFDRLMFTDYGYGFGWGCDYG